MKVHITNIYGQSPRSVAMMSQHLVKDVAQSLGYNEMGIYFYNFTVDSPSELSTRMDGIIASLVRGDVVIFQVPTWNTTTFDETFLDKLIAYGARVVMFVHDVVPLMFEANFYLLERIVAMYNRAEVLILPTKALHDFLKEHGLKHDKVLYQELWDHPVTIPLPEVPFKKSLSFSGEVARFPFVNDWQESLPLVYYGNPDNLNPQANIQAQGWKDETELMLSLAQNGGFGLCWSENRENFERRYSTMNASYKLSTFLAAGLPVIVNHDISSRHLIEKYQLGFAVESLAEAVEVLEKMDEETYRTYANNVQKVAGLLRDSHITRKLLVDAIYKLVF